MKFKLNRFGILFRTSFLWFMLVAIVAVTIVAIRTDDIWNMDWPMLSVQF